MPSRRLTSASVNLSSSANDRTQRDSQRSQASHQLAPARQLICDRRCLTPRVAAGQRTEAD
jgi:hypothetical protein